MNTTHADRHTQYLGFQITGGLARGRGFKLDVVGMVAGQVEWKRRDERYDGKRATAIAALLVWMQ